MVSKTQMRRDRIQEIVQERGAVSVGTLADLLGVLMQTIRRDLETLGDNRNLRRSHGRIELSEHPRNIPFDQRATTNPSGKQAIGARAAAGIPSGATLFLSIGSTVLSVAQALKARKELTVITNNLSAVMALSHEPSNRIIVPGGEVRLPDRDFIGAEVVAFFGHYRAEYAIFGAAGVDVDGSLMEFHQAEVQASEQMRRNARQTTLVIDHSKFGRLAPAMGVNITEIDHVICDRAPGPDFAPLVEQLNTRIQFAEEFA